jgi:hypothetical protein
LLFDFRNYAMKSWKKVCWGSLIAASFAAVALADDAAIVHITDRPAPVPDPGPAAAPATPGAPVAGAASGAPCDGAAGCNGAAACNGGGGCWFNPTRGFQPYASAPVYREAIVYYRYWPDKWYGDPSFNLRPMFPQVYMPTDTTQLGFYYARVPQWMPNSNMYPPTPRASDWHRHVIYAGGGDGGCNTVTAGAAIAPAGGPMPAGPAGPPMGTPPVQSWPAVPAAPNSPPPVAPPVAQPSAMMQLDRVQPAAGDAAAH